VGKGIVDASVVDRHNIRTLFGAGAWDFILVLRVPTSSSHALMGG
jgi:phosphate/sulfate permease